MGILFGDLFRETEDFISFPVLLSDTNVLLEKTEVRFGEVTTELLNYDIKEYQKKADLLLQAYHEEKEEDYQKVRKELDRIISTMPFFSCFTQSPGSSLNLFTLLDDEPPFPHLEGYLQILEDLKTIQTEYVAFIQRLHYKEYRNTQCENYYAVQIQYNGLSHGTRNKSLSNKIDPLKNLEVQYEIRTPDKEPVLDPFTEEDEAFFTLYEKLYVSSLLDFVYIDFFRGLQKKSCPKQCGNCKAWFLQETGVQYEYGDHPAPQDSSRTCRDIGAMESFQQKVKNNPVWQIHQRAYKKYYARMKKGNMTQQEFGDWTVMAEKERDTAVEMYAVSPEDFDLEGYRERLNKG